MEVVKVFGQYEVRTGGKQERCKFQMVSHVVHAIGWDYGATIVRAWIVQNYLQQKKALIQIIAVGYSSRSLFAHATRWSTGGVSQENIEYLWVATSILCRQRESFRKGELPGLLKKVNLRVGAIVLKRTTYTPAIRLISGISII